MKKTIALILCMALCLGALSICAFATSYDFVTVTGTMNSWNPASEADRMTEVSNGVYTITYENMAAGSYEFKFTANGNWSDLDLGGSYMGSGVESTLSWGGSNIAFTLEEAADVTIDLDVNNYKFTMTVGGQVDEAPENITIHIIVPEGWGDIYGYVWNPASLGNWPGTKAENNALTLPAVFDGFIVNNNNDRQTADITDIDLTKPEVWVTVNDDNSYTLSYEAPAGGEEEPAAPTLEDGKYVIAYGDLTFAALDKDKSYGYTYPGDANALTDTDYITITNVANGQFTMQDCYGRYIYMKGTYNNFNVSTELPTEGHLWVLEETEGGLLLKNVEKAKYVAYSEQYGSWGSYPEVSATSVVSFTAVVEEEPAPVVNIKINVIAEHWNAVYAYTYNPELHGSWPGTLVENGVFEVTETFEGLVLNNGEGQQTADIKDIDLTQAEVWITVNSDNSYTIAYEAPVVDDPGNDPVGPETGDAILPSAIILLLSATCLISMTTKKED